MMIRASLFAYWWRFLLAQKSRDVVPAECVGMWLDDEEGEHILHSGDLI